MAATSMRDIRNRIRSVESTVQITKAMELVASSKFLHAKQRMDESRAYFSLLQESLKNILTDFPENTSSFVGRRDHKPALIIVIGGDRGLAGGYNGNIIKLAAQTASGLREQFDRDIIYLPIGKKMIEYYEKTGSVIKSGYDKIEDVHKPRECRAIADMIVDEFRTGKCGAAYIVYTKFENVLTQSADVMQILPLITPSNRDKGARQLPIYEPEAEELLDILVPQYISGLLYCCISEAVACETTARRNAMDQATKNGNDMLDSLSLKYNRARQAVITQEITEIVGGS